MQKVTHQVRINWLWDRSKGWNGLHTLSTLSDNPVVLNKVAEDMIREGLWNNIEKEVVLEFIPHLAFVAQNLCETEM